MHCEEKIIDGRLMARTTDAGGAERWSPATSAHAEAVNALAGLTSEQRKAAFGFFCTYCGSGDPGCSCWNDE